MPFALPPATLVWILQPSVADIARAEALHVRPPSGGHAVMRCYVRADGRLEPCEADPQKTTGGFAAAAVSLQGAYRLDLSVGSASPQVVVSLDFPRMADVAAQIVAEPSPAEVAAAAPVGLAGEVDLECAVTAAGAVDACTLAATPAHDRRLEDGALALSAKYRFKPALLRNKPIATFATISVGVGVPLHKIVEASFARRPTVSEVADSFPERALRMNVSGRATIRCRVEVTGKISACLVVSEAPIGFGFGEAVMRLAPRFSMRPGSIDGKPMPSEITIPVSLNTMSLPPARFDVGLLPWAPWKRTPSAEDVVAAFPRTVVSGADGYASLVCAFAREGGLKDCQTTAIRTSAAFSAAALSLSPRFEVDSTGFAAKDLASKRVVITVDFSARALKPPAERYLRNPDWVRTPDDVAMTDAYPQAAKAAGVLSGLATVDCRVASTGMLEACVPVSETPVDVGFAQAALRMAPLMQANLWTRDGEPASGQKVRLPLRFIFTAAANAPPAVGARKE